MLPISILGLNSCLREIIQLAICSPHLSVLRACRTHRFWATKEEEKDGAERKMGVKDILPKRNIKIIKEQSTPDQYEKR